MKIIIDTRERQKMHFLSILSSTFPNHEFEISKLDEGDFESPSVLVERKTLADLYMSVTQENGKRFNEQVSRLTARSDKVVFFLITGNVNDLQESLQYEGILINTDLLFASISRISSREGLNVLWAPTDEEGLITMVHFMNQVERGEYMWPTRRYPDSLMARYLGITLQQFLSLKMKFSSLEELMNANVGDLEFIHGVGKVKDTKIHNLLHSRW